MWDNTNPFNFQDYWKDCSQKLFTKESIDKYSDLAIAATLELQAYQILAIAQQLRARK